GLGVTQDELVKMVESGSLATKVFFPAFEKGLNETFGSGEKKVEGFTQGWNRLVNAITKAAQAASDTSFFTKLGQAFDFVAERIGFVVKAVELLVARFAILKVVELTASFLGLDLPISGIAGDQQAALFGQTCFEEGESKCTYGTGSFILTNTGTTLQRSDKGLLSTAAWQAPGSEITYALEGSIFVTGAAVQWLRDGLQIVGSAKETEAIAATVDSTDGVYFVPALTGLGAPHWDPHARGVIVGITRGTTRAHLVRATLNAITYEVRDVIDTMPSLTSLAVDGGASANNLLCQLQADVLGVKVQRPQIVETTGLGAAFMAGLGTGVWDSLDDLRHTWQLDQEFLPDQSKTTQVTAEYAKWLNAVERSKGWADQGPVG
ncbi:MAG TPA: FGGY-family carbohydrate kinase, partial [Marmoricola sp.]|nr:FGGY-family carbohydrate kinase [Marmoricola sp.]